MGAGHSSSPPSTASHKVMDLQPRPWEVSSIAKVSPATSSDAVNQPPEVFATNPESKHKFLPLPLIIQIYADCDTRHPDAYHTCYVLAGLSAMQHFHYRTDSSASSRNFASAFSWRSTPIQDGNVYESSDRLQPLHPLLGVPHPSADAMRLWCEARPVTP